MSQHQLHEHARKGYAKFIREFLDNEAAGGVVLLAVALLALIAANSPLASTYFALLHADLGPLSIQHWINDAFMAVFFLLVGLEIKREMLDGRLSTWSSRILPGAAAAGGMLVPALIYVAFNHGNPAALPGWAIPTATDIAFALGVLSLLGSRVPPSLKVFLTALAIIDDLGAVILIALFYTADLNFLALGGAALVIASLVVLNQLGVGYLWPYLVLGAILWLFLWKSGVHATLTGVFLSVTIPITLTSGNTDSPQVSLLHKLEHALQRPVALLIVPIFGFANAGVPLAGVTPSALLEPITLGVASGLIVGKLIGVAGTVALMVGLGLADLPHAVGWRQLVGVSLLCGIGFTMSLFIGLLAFDDSATQIRVKIGIILGSMIAGIAGYLVLRGFSSVRRS